MALDQHAEVVDFDKEDPVEVIRDLTGGIGVDRVIDAVGVDAEVPHTRDGAAGEFAAERSDTADDAQWDPHAAPSQAARWSVRAVAKAGTIGIVGVYPPTLTHWPIGEAMNRNITVKMGNCHHRTYIPRLLQLVRSNALAPISVLTQLEPMPDAIEAYRAFDTREHGWIKVALNPAA
jgi:threonine dehydrogenase-like Zn-dependent dehydrogenase